MEDFRIAQMEDYLNSPAYEADVRRLMAGDYYLSIPEKKMIPKRYTNRKRTVYRLEDNEMTLLRIMAFCLHDYEGLFPEEVYSFKKGISARNFIDKICADQRFQEMYVAKTDIIEYGNSIDAKILISLLEKHLKERDVQAFAFFSWLLSRQTFKMNGIVRKGDTAALPGLPIHSFFSNLYLVEADRFLIPGQVRAFCPLPVIANDKSVFLLSFAALDLRRRRRHNTDANPCASGRRHLVNVKSYSTCAVGSLS